MVLAIASRCKRKQAKLRLATLEFTVTDDARP
jgi:hypothetical protein